MRILEIPLYAQNHHTANIFQFENSEKSLIKLFNQDHVNVLSTNHVELIRAILFLVIPLNAVNPHPTITFQFACGIISATQSFGHQLM